jgi:3-deoxy-D-manno-octulosonate 8-phosphate phosphatase (KDO 8-P phosphatase)
VALLTARRSDLVAARARELGIELVRQGEVDKAAGFARLLADTGVPAAQCGYIGDDWPDLPVLAQAGLAATVADACAECKAIAHWISTAPAGRGAVRELAEFIVRAQGKYDDLLARHSSGGLHA